MSDTSEVGPPDPQPQPDSNPVQITHCPACSRKLLTQASALCNWCGAKIDDPIYQEHAAQNRQALDKGEREQIETLVQEEARYGIFGRLKRRAKQPPNNRNTLS